MNKIEKLERVKPEQLIGMMGEVAPQCVAKELNKIIDYLNQSQKQPKNKSNVKWKGGDILNTIDKDGLPHRFILNEMKEPEKKLSKLLKEKGDE